MSDNFRCECNTKYDYKYKYHSVDKFQDNSRQNSNETKISTKELIPR